MRPPSVLMLTTDQRIDRRILLEADSLEQAGWQVKIVAAQTDISGSDDRRVVRLGSATAASTPAVAALSVYRKLRGLLPLNGAIIRSLRLLAWNLFLDQEQFFVRLFLPTVLRYRADVIVAHDLPMLPVAVAAADAGGSVVVYDSHELYAEQEFSVRERLRWIDIERRYIGRADVVVTVNQSIAAELTRRYGLRDVAVVLNAERPVDAGRLDRIRGELGLPGTAKIMLFQGGLSAGRNLEALVAGMAQVGDPSVHLVVLGDGQLRALLSRRALETGIDGRVHLLGMVPQQQLLSYSASADCGIIPYQSTCLNTHLCTPNKLFEFIAAGTPILASDLPELRRMVEEGGIGMVADLSTPRSIAAAIDAIFADAERLKRFRATLDRVRNEISWTVEGARFAALFDRFRPRGV